MVLRVRGFGGSFGREMSLDGPTPPDIFACVGGNYECKVKFWFCKNEMDRSLT